MPILPSSHGLTRYHFCCPAMRSVCNNPGQEHDEAVGRICHYLLITKSQGLVLKPNKTKGLECYVDTDYTGSWTKLSSHDPLSTHSCTWFYVTYAECPIHWKSKVQCLISLSTTEAEYIALSTALRQVTAIIRLLEDLKSQGFSSPRFYTPHKM